MNNSDLKKKVDKIIFSYQVELAAQLRSMKFGKKVASDFYIHRSCENSLPSGAKLLLLAAKARKQAVKYDLVKYSLLEPKISLLRYPEFWEDPHPSLTRSVSIDLWKQKLRERKYSSENPPILHRKETFLKPSHPRYEQFSLLSKAEELAGLLGSNLIGTKQNWESRLASEGYKISGHTLVKI